MEPQQRPDDTGGPDDPAIDVDAEGDRQCQPANPRLEQIRAAMRLHLQTSEEGVQVIDDDEDFLLVGARRSAQPPVGEQRPGAAEPVMPGGGEPAAAPLPWTANSTRRTDVIQAYFATFGPVPQAVLKFAPVAGGMPLLREAMAEALRTGRPITEWVQFVQPNKASTAKPG